MGTLLALIALAFAFGGRASASAPTAPRPSNEGVPATRAPSDGILREHASAPQQAARELAEYLRRNPAALRQSDLNVATYQARMGGLTVDGQVGPKTRARARALGVTL